MNKVVISSVQAFLSVLLRNPQLLNIASFSHLKPVLQEITNKQSSCKCNKTITSSHRKMFEASMTTLQPGEKAQMKSILNASEICYYILNSDGKLDIACF